MTTNFEHTAAELTAAAKRRMERWLLSPDLQDHMQQAKHVRTKDGEIGPYIAISREAGSRGTEVAQIVGKQLGWDVLDKELLDFIAQRYQLPRDMLEIVDETRANWFHDVLGTFFDSRLVSQDSYVTHLKRILYLAALYGNVVFVGRGAQCVLPCNHGVAVRIIAPLKQRVEHMMQRRHLGRAEAAALVAELDASRAEFCRRHFHHEIQDPLEYDLIINTARLSPEAAAELIVDTLCRAQRSGMVPASGTRK
ncbi:MAG: cytidylate kinase-like family protein [Candidatus Anammoximicrobium sp.]|nr:cytidylate kinase-like family protein [Candidatus Anammoximicrobium sp.]